MRPEAPGAVPWKSHRERGFIIVECSCSSVSRTRGQIMPVRVFKTFKGSFYHAACKTCWSRIQRVIASSHIQSRVLRVKAWRLVTRAEKQLVLLSCNKRPSCIPMISNKNKPLMMCVGCFDEGNTHQEEEARLCWSLLNIENPKVHRKLEPMEIMRRFRDGNVFQRPQRSRRLLTDCTPVSFHSRPSTKPVM